MAGIGRAVGYRLPKFEERFKKEIDQALKKVTHKVGKEVVDTTKKTHKFQNRTKKLEKSIKYAGSIDKKNMYIKATKSYASYVNDGHGSWNGDKFLERGKRIARPKVKRILQQTVDNIIARMNKKQR